MKKLLLLLMCVLTAVGVRAATTYNMSSSYGTGTLVIDDGVATVTVTSGTQGHVFGEWFKNLSTASTPTNEEVINAMKGITKMVYSSGSIFSSADFNDVLNSFTTVTTVDAKGMKMYSTSGNLDIHDLQYVQTLVLDEITAPSDHYPTVSIDNCDALTTLSLKNAFIDKSTDQSNVYQLSVTNNDNLTSIDLDGANIGGGYGYANLDFSGNTKLTTLDLSDVILRPNAGAAHINLGTNNNLSTLLLPEGVNTDNISGNAPTPKVTFSSSDMVLHVADATDPYTYWYQGTMTAKKNITIDMSNLTAGELSSVLASAQAAGVTYNKVKINGAITASDIKALADVNALVLDLSDATISGSMNANSNVKFLVMPDESTREEVTAAAANFTSLLSAVALWEDASNNRHVVGYNTTAGSLQAAIAATGLCSTNGSNYKRGEKTAYYTTLNQDATLRYVTLAGPMNAYDICTQGMKLTDGHFVWDKEAGETADLTDPRTLDGNETVYGAMSGGGPVLEIDLEKATFPVITDMTLSTSGILGSISTHDKKGTWKVIIPTDPSVNEIPAWFLGTSGNSQYVREICIPSNIEIIRNHAFCSLYHVWTTANDGDIEGTIYDNGVYDYDAADEDSQVLTGYTGVDETKPYSKDNTQPRYGPSFTFSSNIKLIESYAFNDSRPNVKDVYVLSEVAPECHVDAFSNQMYFGINGFGNKVVDGIIARESYVNNNRWITMLHFPRNTTDPNIQRYTDPTRKYSIASTVVDSKGNNVNLPTQSEFNAAFKQGTTGYLWGAWDQTLQWGMMTNGIAETVGQWSKDNQKAANDYVTGVVNGEKGKNQTDLTKNPYVAFYDLTADGQLTHPSPIVPYYQVYWNGKTYSTQDPGNLYPAASTDYVYEVAENGDYYYNTSTGAYEQWTASAGEVTRYNRRTTQVETGEYTTECEDAKYVRDENYVENSAGKFVRTMTIVPNGSQYVQDYEWVEAKNGLYSHQPIMADDGKYFKKQDYEKDDNGNWVFVYGAWREWEGGDNVSTWGITPEPQRYSIVTKWAEWNNDWGQQRYNFSDNYVLYNDDYLNITRYNKEYKQNYREPNSTDAADEPRYDITWGEYATYNDGTNYGTYGTDYLRYNVEYSYRLFDSSIDDASAQRYCPLYETVEVLQVTKKNDYRGWHQFVLTGYADPTTDIIINHRSYITDNDWWTICLPYDLNYKEMMLFYGDPKTGKIPYLALLTNVVRDLGEQTITLNFSENLMTHKAYRTNGVWTVTNEAPSKAADAGKDDKVNETDNDIVLHAGVPYLIRPNRIAQAGGSFTTQFDIYGQENVNESLSEGRVTATNVDYPLLYTKMETANELGSYDAMALVEKGIYTVPALVKNNGARADGVAAEGVSSTKLDVKINSEIENLPISTDWDYSFVGNLYYNSFLPQNSYFLGWYEKARFFYADYTLSAVTDMSDKNYKFVNVRLWNNNTGIICPNMMKSSKYHASNGTETANDETQTYVLGKGNYYGLITPGKQASQGTQPAQWLIGRAQGSAGTGDGALANDWFSGGSAPQHAAAANPVLMDFGITNMAEVTGIEEVKTETKTIPAINDNKVYTIDGRYAGNSIEGLGKGLYILNGKKVVVK